MRAQYERFFWLLVACVAFCLFVSLPGRAATRRCFPHGHSASATVEMCVTRLGNDHCRLMWYWRVSDSTIVHDFGGIVMCGGGAGKVSDPGDRRPK